MTLRYDPTYDRALKAGAAIGFDDAAKIAESRRLKAVFDLFTEHAANEDRLGEGKLDKLDETNQALPELARVGDLEGCERLMLDFLNDHECVTHVALIDLKARPELNGRRGRLCGVLQPENNRWPIRVPSEDGGKEVDILLKTVNLRPSTAPVEAPKANPATDSQAASAAEASSTTPAKPIAAAEMLRNGGHTALYRWGQTLEEVTCRLPVGDLRAKDVKVSFSRCHVQVKVKSTSEALLEGELQQPILCDESSWMLEDGEMVLQLAKDNQRRENTEESSAWWHGILEGEDSIDSKDISVEDYVRPDQLPAEEREKAMRNPPPREPPAAAAAKQPPPKSTELLAAEAETERGKQRQAELEAGLPAEKRAYLDKLRKQFPDIPIDWGGAESIPGAATAAGAAGQGIDAPEERVGTVSYETLHVPSQ
tara:strand:+ start:652 stop:1926 length:1275 start_codon:yes stop_codon:yes gene_type:complete